VEGATATVEIRGAGASVGAVSQRAAAVLTDERSVVSLDALSALGTRRSHTYLFVRHANKLYSLIVEHRWLYAVSAANRRVNATHG
jgi:hypothetical protein